MNTIELARDLSENVKTRKQFKGIFPSDCLPKYKLRKPAFVVANTDNSNQPGTHWVAFYFPKTGKGEYFDSFGHGPINIDFIKFLKRNSTNYIYNKQQLQSDASNYCGQFCCMFLHYKCVGKTLKQFIKLFSATKFNYNDDKVINLYHTVYSQPGKMKKKPQVGGKAVKYLPYIQTCKPRSKNCRV